MAVLDDTGQGWRYVCSQDVVRFGAACVPLTPGEVMAARAWGSVRNRRGWERAVWDARLAHEAGVLPVGLPLVRVPQLPQRVGGLARRILGGAVLLAQLRAVLEGCPVPDVRFPYSRDFAAAWSLVETPADGPLRTLQNSGALVRVPGADLPGNFGKPTPVYRLGEGRS